MGRKISDQGQWLNSRNTMTAFYDEMVRNANRIDNLKEKLGNANNQLNDQNEELVKLRADKKDLWSKVYGQNNNVSDGRARIRELTESEKMLKQENERLQLRLKQIKELWP